MLLPGALEAGLQGFCLWLLGGTNWAGGLEIRADRGELTGAKPSLQHSHPVAISSIETFRRSFHRMVSRQAKIL
jgi:hypothetical protein